VDSELGFSALRRVAANGWQFCMLEKSLRADNAINWPTNLPEKNKMTGQVEKRTGFVKSWDSKRAS